MSEEKLEQTQNDKDPKVFNEKESEYTENFEDTIEIPKEQRKIRTQAYDKSIEDTVRMIENNRIFLQPDFQRYSGVWDLKTSSLLIESILLNVPIPPIYVAEEEDGTWNIIDGLQRLTTFKEFYSGKFKLRGLESLKELNKLEYKTLNQKAKTILDNGNLRIVLITKESHPEMKYDIFMRLNRGSVKLTEQELRNCLYRGKLNDLIKNLRNNKNLLNILNLTEPHHRMIDAELILRYLAISEKYDNIENKINGYNGIMRSFLNEYMNERRDITDKDIVMLENKFNDTLDKVYAVFERNAFRRIEENGEYYKWINKSIFDFIMLSFEKYDKNKLISKKHEIINSLKDIVNNNIEFEQAITVGTSEPKKLKYRLSKWQINMTDIMR